MKILFFWAVSLATLANAVSIQWIKLNRRGARRGIAAELTLSGLAKEVTGNKNVDFKKVSGEIFHSAKGLNSIRVVQTYGNADVIGTVAEAEVNEEGVWNGNIHGMIAAGLEVDIPDQDACPRTDQEMLTLVAQAEGLDPDSSDIDNVIVDRRVRIDPETEIAELVYYVEFVYYGEERVSRPSYYINACDLSVVVHYDQIMNASISRERREIIDEPTTEGCVSWTPTFNPSVCDPDVPGVGGNEKTGVRTYNIPPDMCLNPAQSGDTCTFLNVYSKVVDNAGSTSRNKQTPISFVCSQGFSDPVNGAYSVANDAFFFGNKCGTLYEAKYNFRALPWTPRLVVHYSRCYDNAFWDGRDMYFGDGCSYFYPLVSQDVVTHELAHGITSTHSNLEYREQPGGINEAFSDIAGEVSEVWSFPEGNDWMVGEQLFKRTGALRYFDDPTRDGRSIGHADDFRSGMDVHYSSGVFNRAFYIMVHDKGLDIYEAFDCFLVANRQIWTVLTQFDAGGCGVAQACIRQGIDHTPVVEAFEIVGIDFTGCDLSLADTPLVPGETRRDLKASKTRKPILGVERTPGQQVTVSAVSTDGSPIKISFCPESLCKTTDKSGEDTLTSESNEEMIYVQFCTDTSSDVTFTVNVSQ